VLAQTLKPDEFIVVDDGSTDEGLRIVERLAKRHPIRLLRKRNGGQSSARNFGVSQSKSALIALLDQDDAWYPHHLETLIRPFREPRKIPLGWVYSNLDHDDENTGMTTRRLLDLLHFTENPKRELARCLAHDMFILPSASLISRRAFESVGRFDERLCGYEDDDLFLRIFRAGYGNVYIDEPLSTWRIHKSSSSFSESFARSRMIFAGKLFEQFPDEPKRGQYFCRDYIAMRFTHHTLVDWRTALEQRDKEMFRVAVRNLRILRPRLALKRRLALLAVLMLSTRFDLASAALKTRKWARPIALRFLTG
jgi:glycosyltransferase involved in cell wall biosynthesis